VRDVAAVPAGETLVHGYLVDLTRERELERQLANERAQTEAFFRDAAVGLAINGADGRYLRVNEALARIIDPVAELSLRGVHPPTLSSARCAVRPGADPAGRHHGVGPGAAFPVEPIGLRPGNGA